MNVSKIEMKLAYDSSENTAMHNSVSVSLFRWKTFMFTMRCSQFKMVCLPPQWKQSDQNSRSTSRRRSSNSTGTSLCNDFHQIKALIYRTFSIIAVCEPFVLNSPLIKTTKKEAMHPGWAVGGEIPIFMSSGKKTKKQKPNINQNITSLPTLDIKVS